MNQYHTFDYFISHDTITGTLELNLNHMPKPAKKSSHCSLDQLPDLSRGISTNSTTVTSSDPTHSASSTAAVIPQPSGDTNAVKTISLFEQKRIRGFWPCYNDVDNKRELTVNPSAFLRMQTMLYSLC